MWINFVKNLKESGYVDGLFPDKSSILAEWNETGSFWQICEWGTGKNTWNISCGIISNETAKKYNDAKPMVLETLYEIFAPNGFLFYSNLTAFLKLNKDQSPLNFANDVKAQLSNHQYCYVHMRDLQGGDCTSIESSCKTDEIVFFLLGVETGAILGCNGWDDQFSKPLGDPLGPAVQKGMQLERHFKSGTYVTWDLSKKTGKIFWANSTLSN